MEPKSNPVTPIADVADKVQHARDVAMPPIMRYFESAHLPGNLRVISGPFQDLAKALIRATPSGPEQSAGLRKLLEAKDCFVRAALP